MNPEILELMQAELKDCQILVALLKQEGAALQTSDIEALPEITSAKNMKVVDLNQLTERRMALFPERNAEAIDKALRQHPETEPVWVALRAAASEARELNLQNGHLIEHRLMMAQKLIQAISEAVEAVPVTYDGQGACDTPGSTGGRSFGRA